MSADDLVSDLRESAAFLIGQGDDGTEGGAHYRLNDHNICGRCSGRWPCMEAQIGYEARAAADALEARDAEIERLRAERGALRQDYEGQHWELEDLRAVVRVIGMDLDIEDVPGFQRPWLVLHPNGSIVAKRKITADQAAAVRRALTTEGDTP